MKRGSTKVRSFRLLWLVTIGALVLTTASCELLYKLFNQPPQAGFTVGPSTVGSVPFPVTMSAATSSDPDENIESYAWDFGDGVSGSGASVTHTYTAVGTYTIVLTVTDKYGAKDTATKVVYVLEAQTGPVANFTASPTSGTSPLTVSFDASDSTYTDGTIQSYSWDFGDGHTSVGATTSHTYSTTTAKTYTVTLTIRGTDGETDTATTTISVSTSSGGGNSTSDNPSAQFSATPTTGVAPLRCVFDPKTSEAAEGHTLIKYIWSFGDGGSGYDIDATEKVWVYTPSTTSKTYSVNLTVQDNDGNTDNITKTVKVYNHRPVPGFEIGNPPGGDADASGVRHYAYPDKPTEDNGGFDTNDVNEWIADDVHYGRVAGYQTVSVVIRSRKIFGTKNWYGLTSTGKTQATLKMADETSAVSSSSPAAPSGYADHNFSYDPEGQKWADTKPSWFASQGWGIRYLYVSWGDSTAEDRFDFADEADTVMWHVYSYSGSAALPRVISVTAEDWLGQKSASFSRTVWLQEGDEGSSEI